MNSSPLRLLPFFVAILCVACPGQDEAAAIRTFKKDFKPNAKAIELPAKVFNLPPASSGYQEAAGQRREALDKWHAAAKGLSGHSSEAVAKLVAGAWVRVDKLVASLWKEHAKLEKAVSRAYDKFLKANGGPPPAGAPVARKAVSAMQLWLLKSKQTGLKRLDITELVSLEETLRGVVDAMDQIAGPRWLLKSVVGSKKHGLVFKMSVVRAAARLGEPMAADFVTALDKARAPDVLAALAVGLGMLGERAKDGAPKLIALLDHEDSGVREHAALALGKMKVGAAIKPMIGVLGKEQGQARRRIATVLEILTGQQFGTSVSAWERWYRSEGAAYASGGKPLGQGKPSNKDEFNKKNYYYGIPQIGKGILYVIDCSGSMVVDKDNPVFDGRGGPSPARSKKNSRSEASKRELIRALKSLSGDQRFNIIWYNHEAKAFQKKMQPASPQNKAAAESFVNALPAASSTNIYGAMKLAFTLTGRGSYDKYYGVEFDTIFLLTDGKPTLQGVGEDDPNKIIEGVRQWNALKRVVIHTIAMGDKGVDHNFMQKLADENRGQYRKILKGGKVVDGKSKPAAPKRPK